MRKTVMVLALLTTACSQNSNAGLHTVDGRVPLYVDAAQSGTRPPMLPPRLIDQARTAANLGDALRVLGPAYMASNEPARIARWHFTNGTTLTLWPQGGERLSDGVSVYPSPNCRTQAYACHDLVLGRSNRPTIVEEELTPEEREHALYRQYTPQPFVPAQPQPQPDRNSNKPSAGELFEQGLANTAVQTTNSIAQGLAHSSIGVR